MKSAAKYFINRLIDICDKQIESLEDKKVMFYSQYTKIVSNENSAINRNPYLYQAIEFIDKKLKQESNKKEE